MICMSQYLINCHAGLDKSATAGIQLGASSRFFLWIPASAGMTKGSIWDNFQELGI
jgi:hypothetical protein